MKKILTKSLLFSLIFFIIFIISLGIYLNQQINYYLNKIYPNVYINNSLYSGLSKEQVFESYNNKNSILKKIRFTLKYENEIASFSGEIIELNYNPENIWQQAYSIGRSDNIWTKTYQQIGLILNLDSYYFSFKPSYSLDQVQDYLIYLEEKYNIPPENALFEIKNNKVSAFKIEKEGQKIESDLAIASIKSYIDNLDLNKPSHQHKLFNIKIGIVQPDIRLSTINNYGIIEKIGEGQSDYTGSTQQGRLHNIALASSKLHGILIQKGDTFSFNNSIGDVSASTGFEQAYIIKAGKTVLGDGGGVCQVSTTLFRAAINSGLPIVERHAHAYRVHYYENDSKPGFDATVYAPGVDLKFINDTPAYILIQTENDTKNQILTFSLYGKKDNRIIEVSPIKVWDVISPPEPLYQDEPTLTKGVTKQVEHSSPGTKAIFHYKVVVDGVVTQDTDIFSNFKPWRAVYLVGTKE